MIIKFWITFLFIIPCTSAVGMLRFLGMDHRPTKEITEDIVKSELIEDDYQKHEALRSLYGEWHEAVTSQLKFNGKFALAIEELQIKHKNLAAQIKEKRDMLKQEKMVQEKKTSVLEKIITKILQTKNENEGLEEKETRLISLKPHLEQLKELHILHFEKFENCDRQLQEIKKIVTRREIFKNIQLFESKTDLSGLIHAYHLLLETYDTDLLISSTQAKINDLQNRLSDNEQEQLDATKCQLEHAAFSAQIELLKYNTKKSDFSRKADLACLLEKRARVYKNVKENKELCDADNSKARQLWFQALAIAPNPHAKQEILMHLV